MTRFLKGKSDISVLLPLLYQGFFLSFLVGTYEFEDPCVSNLENQKPNPLFSTLKNIFNFHHKLQSISPSPP